MQTANRAGADEENAGAGSEKARASAQEEGEAQGSQRRAIATAMPQSKLTKLFNRKNNDGSWRACSLSVRVCVCAFACGCEYTHLQTFVASFVFASASRTGMHASIISYRGTFSVRVYHTNIQST